MDGLVYMVDAAENERLSESKKELDALLSDDSLEQVLFLILGNKINIPYVASEDKPRYFLGLSQSPKSKNPQSWILIAGTDVYLQQCRTTVSLFLMLLYLTLNSQKVTIFYIYSVVFEHDKLHTLK